MFSVVDLRAGEGRRGSAFTEEVENRISAPADEALSLVTHHGYH